jgi:hypothetical protein
MLETLIGVGVLVAVILAAKTIFARNGGSTPTVVGGGGHTDEGTGTGDGSVTPPSGPTAE